MLVRPFHLAIALGSLRLSNCCEVVVSAVGDCSIRHTGSRTDGRAKPLRPFAWSASPVVSGAPCRPHSYIRPAGPDHESSPAASDPRPNNPLIASPLSLPTRSSCIKRIRAGAVRHVTQESMPTSLGITRRSIRSSRPQRQPWKQRSVDYMESKISLNFSFIVRKSNLSLKSM